MKRTFNSFESFNKINENVGTHYMEDIQKAFDKELDPFPIIWEITFEQMDDDVYEFNLSEKDFDFMTPYPDEEYIGWFILRQAIYEALGGTATWNNSKHESFYINSQGMQSIISKSPAADVNGVLGDNHITIFKKLSSTEEMFIAFENILFKPYKMYPAILR